MWHPARLFPLLRCGSRQHAPSASRISAICPFVRSPFAVSSSTCKDTRTTNIYIGLRGTLAHWMLNDSVRCGVLDALQSNALYSRIQQKQRFAHATYNHLKHFSNATNSCKAQPNSALSLQGADAKGIVNPGFLMRFVPAKLLPYVQLSRVQTPIGTWLLFWPCAWSICMAAQPEHAALAIYHVALCGMGAILMRSAGCVINDLWDRDLDKFVERTRSRPLASQQLTVAQALRFLSLNLFGALLVLLQFNPFTILVGLSSMGLVVLYPLMKRITYLPQAVLGFAFNWGALLGWTTISGCFAPPVIVPICLYLGGICWTVVYDTIYAHQDKSDDILVGIKSTALLWGDSRSFYWLTAFSIAMLFFLTLSGIANGMMWPYYASMGIMGTHLAYMIKTVDFSLKESCRKLFFANKWTGFIVFSGIVTSNALSFYYSLTTEQHNGYKEDELNHIRSD